MKQAGAGQVAAERILGAQAHLNGVSAQGNIDQQLGGYRVAIGDTQLQRHKVDTGDQLRHRMLDL